MSLVEAVANVVVGYGVAALAQILLFPVFGLTVTLRQNLAIGMAFTTISIVRSLLRRLFEAWSHATFGFSGSTARSGRPIPPTTRSGGRRPPPSASDAALRKAGDQSVLHPFVGALILRIGEGFGGRDAAGAVMPLGLPRSPPPPGSWRAISGAA